jgi:hypothetical protein
MSTARKSGARASCDRPGNELKKKRELKMIKRVMDPEVRDLLLFKDMTIIPLSGVCPHLFQPAEFSL